MQYINKPLINFPALSLNQDEEVSGSAPTTTAPAQKLKNLSYRKLSLQSTYTQVPVASSSKRKVNTSANHPFARSNKALFEFVRGGGL